MVELKDLPWECVAEEPKEPENWEEFCALIGPRSSETRDTFFEKMDEFIPYYVNKIHQFPVEEPVDVIMFCRCASRIIMYAAGSSKQNLSQLAVGLGLLELMEPIQKLEELLGLAYSSLVLNTVVALYSDEQTREEAIRLLLENRVSLLGKIDEFDKNFDVPYDQTLSVIVQILMDRIEGMESQQQKEWIIILVELMYAAHFFPVDEGIIHDLFTFAKKELRIPGAYKCLIQLAPFLLSHQKEDDEERQLPKKEAEKVFSTFKKLVRTFSQKMTKEIRYFRDLIGSLASFTFYALNDGKLLGEWIVVSDLPDYKKELLADPLIWQMDSLYQAKEFLAIVTLHRSWWNDQDRTFVEKQKKHLFQLAFSYTEIGDDEKGRELYERYLQDFGENAAVINNLGVIEEHANRLDKALGFYQKACELEPIPLHKNNLKRVQDKIKEREKRPKLLRDRYFKTEKTHKKILFSVYNLSGEGPVTEERLQEVAGFGTKLPKLLKELMAKELVHWDRQNGYSLDPDIVETVKAWVDPQLQAQIIKHSRNKLYKPIFFHESEYRLYRVLVELFPQHLIFPNMALQSIIDYDKLKDHVEPDVFEYYLKTHVDFAVINTTNYLPLILFEKDSEYHDEGRQLENTKKKNLIFQVAGLPLVRLRFNRNMDEARLKEEVKQVTKELLSQLMHSENDYDQEILTQFDLKAFGISRDPLDLDAVHVILKDQLGEAVYGHLQEVNWEENHGVLVLKAHSAIRPVLELAWDKLTEKLYQEFRLINRVDKVWV